MALTDDEGPARKAGHAIGQDLSALSLDELSACAEALRGEIIRIEEAIRAKQASALAADAFFKR